MKILVTGASGFTGAHLIRHLSTLPGIDIGAVSRSVQHLEQDPVCRYCADITDRAAIREVIRSFSPDAVIHLAGRNHGSFEDLLLVNSVGTENLLEAVRHVTPGCRVLLVSSSAVYGNAGEAPISESVPSDPLSLYGISKVTSELVARYYHRAWNVRVAVARPFNLIGPGQTEDFLCGHIVNEVMAIREGRKNAIQLRENRSSRDFIDVRDVVEGYAALITCASFDQVCAGRAFNLGSGRSCSVMEIVHTIEEITGETFHLELPPLQPELLIPSQKSDNSRITALTGWVPRRSLKTSLSDMLHAHSGRL